MKQVYDKRDEQQKATSIASSTLTIPQDFKSRVNAASSDLNKSTSRASASAVSLPPKSFKFKKQTASGMLIYEKNAKVKFQPCASIKKIKFKTVGRKAINTESKAITIVPGLDVQPLDEDYDIEGLEYLLA